LTKAKVRKSPVKSRPKSFLTWERTLGFVKFKDSKTSIFLIIFFGISFSIYQGLQSRWILQNGDAAGFVDAFRPRGLNQFSNFTYGSSGFQLMDLIGKGTLDFRIEDFLNDQKNFNVFNSHAYLSTYLFRNLNIFFSSPEILPLILVASSYASGITLLFKMSKTLKINTLQFICATTVLVTSPVFYEGLVGQPYMDRLFFGPCIAVLYLIECEKYLSRNGFILTFSLVLLTISLSERAALMIGITVLIQLIFKVFHSKLRNKKSYALITLSLLSILWYFVWNYIFSNTPYSGVITLQDVFRNLSELFVGARHQNFQTFIFCLFPFLLFGLFQIKYLFLSLVVILPNLIYTIGGAELVGFATHYHAHYLPIISFMLFVKPFDTKRDTKRIKSFRSGIYAFSALVGITASMSYLTPPSQSPFQLSNVNLTVQHIGNALGAQPSNIRDSRKFSREERLTLFNQTFLKMGRNISAPEGLMPALTLLGFEKIDYFPIGLGFNHIVIVPFTDATFSRVEISLYGLVPEADRSIWSSKIMNILKERYVQKSNYVGQLGNIAIYEFKVEKPIRD
jgi:hypothetical protein